MTDDRSNPRNPWLDIPPSAYEGHMGPSGVDQLSVMNRIFKETYIQILPRRLAVLGCATGNGFEHVDPGITSRLVGVDINDDYLWVARGRFSHLAPVLETVCAPIEKCSFDEAAFDFIFAALFFEYVDPDPVLKIISSWLCPGGALCAILQLPSLEEGVVSQTDHSEQLEALEEIIRLVSPEDFLKLARFYGLSLEAEEEIPLRHGKRFYKGILKKS